MKHIIYYLSIFLLTLGACKKAGDGQDPKPGSNPETSTPLSRPAGNPIGEAVMNQIGPAGGTITSDDQVVRISVPAGAVNSLTSFSIQRVENNLDTIHPAYRFLPEGVQFAKMVTITYHYAKDSLGGNDPDLFNLVYRDAAGHYFKPKGMSHDPQAKTFSIQTTHFSDWNISENYEIQVDGGHSVNHSPEPHLGGGESLKLYVAPTYGTSDDTTQLFIPPVTQSEAQQHAEWKIVSGPGSLENSVDPALVTYHAPANLTGPASVLISCTLNGNFGKDNRGNAVQKMILLQTIYLDADFFSVSIDGADPVQLLQIGVVDMGNSIVVTGQDFALETFEVIGYTHGTSAMPFNVPGTDGASYMEMNTITGVSYKTYYPKDCDGKVEGLNFSSGSVSFTHVGTHSGDYIAGKIEGATVYGNNWCSGPGVKKHAISGTFNLKIK